jgi:ABC-type phosphate/phosphonate transport system permease subunit
MAEIKIEKKKPVWPWILLLIIIALLVYYFFFRDRETEQEVIQDVEETTSMKTDVFDDEDKAIPPVFVRFVRIHEQIA